MIKVLIIEKVTLILFCLHTLIYAPTIKASAPGNPQLKTETIVRGIHERCIT